MPILLNNPTAKLTTGDPAELLADFMDKALTAWGRAYTKAYKREPDIRVVGEACLMILENVCVAAPDFGDRIIETIRQQKLKIAAMRDDTAAFVKNS